MDDFTPKDDLIEILASFGYPVILQGSLGKEESYPDSFFTFFNNETMDNEFYDNLEHEIIWDFDVNFYSTNPALVNSMLRKAKRLLRGNGYIIDGVGYDVISDEATHTGRGMNVTYIEREVNQ